MTVLVLLFELVRVSDGDFESLADLVLVEVLVKDLVGLEVGVIVLEKEIEAVFVLDSDRDLVMDMVGVS